jgi:hypothetical protein
MIETLDIAVVSPQRMMQLDAAMNVGYNQKVATLCDTSQTIQSAASRGNPFAISALLLTSNNNVSNASNLGMCPERRLQQLNATMNERYIEKLAKMSPTRTQAAARGNPFAIFETNWWKSSEGRRQHLELSREVPVGGKLAAPSETNSLRATAAAKGSPYALIGTTHSKHHTSTHVGSGQNLNGKVAPRLDGGRLEASLVMAASSSAAATSTWGTSIAKKLQSNQAKPRKSADSKSSAVPAKTFACTRAQDSNDPSLRVPVPSLRPQPAAEETEYLLTKRQANHKALRIVLPASPSECDRMRSAQHQNVLDTRGKEEEALPPALENAAVLRTEFRAEVAVKEHRAVAESCDVITSCMPAGRDEQPSDTTLVELAATIDDLEQKMRGFGDLIGAHDENVQGAADYMEVSDASSAKRLFGQNAACRGEEIDDCELMSPKTLFPDTCSDVSSLIATRLPEEQSLACVVLHSLNLPPEVATMVARYMKETVRQNLAASTDFRAKFSAAAPLQTDSCSGHTAAAKTLVLAERAVQLQAAKNAAEEEEQFHRMVVAVQGTNRRVD